MNFHPTFRILFVVTVALCFNYSISKAVNVKDYRAKGNGVTDDTDAIKAAIAGASDGLVEFPRGRYRITKTINVVLAGSGQVSLSGRGATATIIMEGKGPAFKFIGSHNGTASPASIKPITWERERMPLLEALEIVGTNTQADGLEFHHTLFPVFRSLLIHNVRHGIHLTSRNRNVIIEGCHIYNCSGVGIYLDSVNLHQIIIGDSHISYCRNGGIKVSKSEIRNFQITGNDIEYNYDSEGPVSADIWIDGMKNMFFNLSEDSTLYGDSAYIDYNYEQVCLDAENIKLMIARKSNSKKPHEPWENFLIADSRKRIETTFSQITNMFPKRIHAVTKEGFLLKVVLFIFVFTINEKFL